MLFVLGGVSCSGQNSHGEAALLLDSLDLVLHTSQTLTAIAAPEVHAGQTAQNPTATAASELAPEQELKGGAMGKPEPNAMDNLEPNAMGNSEPNAMGNPDRNAMGKPALNAMGNSEPDAMGKSEANAMGRQQPNALMPVLADCLAWGLR